MNNCSKQNISSDYEYNYEIERTLSKIILLPFPRNKLIYSGLIILAIVFSSFITNDIDSNDIIVILLGLSLVLIGLFPKIIPHISYENFQGLKSGEFLSVTVRFEEHIIYQIAHETIVYSYRDLVAIITTNNLFILVNKNHDWIVIKKGTLTGLTDHEFIDYIKSRCPQL